MTRHIAGLLFAISFVALPTQVAAGFSCDDRVLDRFDATGGEIDVEDKDDDCRFTPDQQAGWVEINFGPDPARLAVIFELNIDDLLIPSGRAITLFDLQRLDGWRIVTIRIEERAGQRQLVAVWSSSGAVGGIIRENVLLAGYEQIRVSWQASRAGQSDGWIRLHLDQTELTSVEGLQFSAADVPVLARVGALDWDPDLAGELWFRPMGTRWWYFRPGASIGPSGK